MKLKAAITQGAPVQLFEAFGSREFAVGFDIILKSIFEITDARDNPAAYYVQMPDTTVARETGIYGVEVRLTGVSRGSREPKLFHEALSELEKMVVATTQRALTDTEVRRVQVFVAIMIDGDVPGPPKSGSYSSILETTPKWVSVTDVAQNPITCSGTE